MRLLKKLRQPKKVEAQIKMRLDPMQMQMSVHQTQAAAPALVMKKKKRERLQSRQKLKGGKKS